MEEIRFDKDFKNRTITVVTTYAAPLATVWNAYTDPRILEQWWGPKPWKAITKTMDFKKGGRWLYYMLSPDGVKQWSLAEFGEIVTQRSFEAVDAFSDENGNIDTSFPRLRWKVSFDAADGKTTVTSLITASDEADIRKLLELGFEEGYKTGIRQLHELLK